MALKFVKVGTGFNVVRKLEFTPKEDSSILELKANSRLAYEYELKNPPLMLCLRVFFCIILELLE